ncbi:hypothetical protein GCM10022216_27300 [Sphingobacterium kyonggiense]|uniref:Uncharacterized protein n=2 Tax=Sphingobacteriaceae TaxID=84566 RepID=A0ABP7YZT4_9SPHI
MLKGTGSQTKSLNIPIMKEFSLYGTSNIHFLSEYQLSPKLLGLKTNGKTEQYQKSGSTCRAWQNHQPFTENPEHLYTPPHFHRLGHQMEGRRNRVKGAQRKGLQERGCVYIPFTFTPCLAIFVIAVQMEKLVPY